MTCPMRIFRKSAGTQAPGSEPPREKANQARAKLYVSIHANADPSPRWRGRRFYDGSSEEGKAAAVAIQRN